MSILWVLVIPALYTISNLADKCLLDGDGEDSEPRALMTLGGFFSLFALLPAGIWVYFSHSSFGTLGNIIPLMFNEILFVVATWIYLAVMKKEESTRVVPWMQSIPIFGMIGGAILLNEMPSGVKILAVLVLVAGGFLLSYHNGRMNKKIVGTMILVSIIFAVYDVIFAKYGRTMDDSVAIFINLAGKFVWTLLFLVNKKTRQGVLTGLKTKIKGQTLSEMTSTIGNIGLCLALLYFPVNAVQALCCSQPMFLLIGALVLTNFFPQIVCEETEGLTLAQKSLGIILVITGGVILSI